MMPELFRRKHLRGRGALAASVACALVGCQAPVAEPSAGTQPAVTIDLAANGAAGGSRTRPTEPPQPMARDLAFTMSGTASRPEAVGVEARSQASQAAIVDAFYRAVAEVRRSRGQSAADFTARMGPRLTLTHRTAGGANEVRIALITGRGETTIEVRDGRLTHPPHDIRVLRQVFEETNGEFVLLGTDWDLAPNCCVARVGCYVPREAPRAALAGDASTDEDGIP